MEQEATITSSNQQKPTFQFEVQNLPKGSSVAVLTLLGSLCPITLAHVQAFLEARHLLLATPNHHDPSLRPADLVAVDHVVGFISVNPDSYVARKFLDTDGLPISYNQRVALVKMAIADIPWMGVEDSEGETYLYLKHKYPNLNVIHFTINGADDVVKYRKWRYAPISNTQSTSISPNMDRFITMGRAGQTRLVLEGMERSGIAISQFFFLGPELPDISSTRAREVLKQGDRESLRDMLHPRVMDWCLAEGRWSRDLHLVEDPTVYHDKEGRGWLRKFCCPSGPEECTGT